MKYCCNDLKYHLEHQCEIHDSVFDCCDHLFFYNRVYDEYGVILHDGGSSYIVIRFCPFCGHEFPKSKREEYFNLIYNELKITSLNDLSEEFKTDEWWKKRGLQ